MNEKNTEDLFHLLLNATYLAALPDSEKQKLWKQAEEERPQAPIVHYFENISKGMPVASAWFEKIRLGLS
jgi:hypothetical protein